MEWKEAALDGQADGKDSGADGEDHKESRILCHLRNRLLHGDHEQMSRQVIEQGDAQQEETGSQKVQDHIADRRKCGPADLTDDQASAAGQSQDLQEDITGEKVVGPENGHQRRRHQIEEGIIQIDLALIQIRVNIPISRQDRTDHDDHEQDCQQSLQNTRPDLISPWSGEFTHGIGDSLSCGHDIPQDKAACDQQDNLIKDRIKPGCFSF